MLKGMNRGGFSIIEVVITITVLAILLTLGVVGMNATQVNARDAERKADVEAIAVYFEDFYKNDRSWDGVGGTYIGGWMINDLSIHNMTIDRKTLRAPGVKDHEPQSLIASTNTVESTSGVLPQPTINQYVYQPIADNGNWCGDHLVLICSRFNIYYRLEKDNSVQMITSKNQ